MGQPLVGELETKTLFYEPLVHGHGLEFDPINNWVFSRWYGFVSKHNLIGSANSTLQLLLETNCPNLLIDHRDVHGTWADITDWLQNIWLPGVLQAGLQKYAHVALPGSYSVMHAESLFARIHGKLEMMIFSDLEDAQIWLKSN